MKIDLFDRITVAESVLGINSRNLEGVYPHNRRRNFPNVDDKLRCKELLKAAGLPVPETYYVVRGRRDVQGWNEALDGIDRFVIKQNGGYGGGGVAPVVRKSKNFQMGDETVTGAELEFHILQIINGAFTRDNVFDIAYFEYFIDCSGLFGELIPPDVEGVPDIRIIYRDHRPPMAMLRLPTRESGGRANLHQGGIGVGIDLSNGITNDGCHKNRAVEKHPDTDVPLKGRLIPHFSAMCEMGIGIGNIVGLGFVGVDFVVDRHLGPMILEVNARPGLSIQIANRVGLRREIG